LNPVPLFFIEKDYRTSIKPGKLADIAPSILTWMDIPLAKEMTGDILIS